MDEAINVVFGNGFSYTLGTFNMDILKIKVPMANQLGSHQVGRNALLCWIVSSDKVVDDVRMPHALFDGGSIPKVPFLDHKSGFRERMTVSSS